MGAAVQPVRQTISIHALREEGDVVCAKNKTPAFVFLSTPSARRATAVQAKNSGTYTISIHALREEGDTDPVAGTVEARKEFLSTPSARRATH